MQRILISFLAVPLVLDSLAAQTVDTAKLRAAIERPRSETVVHINPSKSRDSKGLMLDPLQEIAKDQKLLTGTVADVEIYARLGENYRQVKDEPRRVEAYQKAKQMLEPYLKTTDPKQAYLLVLYCNVLAELNLDVGDECDTWARKAVMLAPEDWRGWNCLGGVTCYRRIIRLALAESWSKIPDKDREAEYIRMLVERRATPEKLDAMDKLLSDARSQFDRAKALAPESGECRARRADFLLREANLRILLAIARGQKPATCQQVSNTPEILEELKCVARLNPEDLRCQTIALTELVDAHTMGWFDKHVNRPWKEAPPIPKDEQKTIEDCLGRVEKIAARSSPDGALYCHRLLQAYAFFLLDAARAERYCRWILQADAQDSHTCELLINCLSINQRSSESVRLAHDCLEKFPTARSLVIFARELEADKQIAEAEKILRAAIKRHPDCPDALLLLASLLMRTSDKAESWHEAGRLLKTAQPLLLSPDTLSQRMADFDYLQAIQKALTDNALLGQLKLQVLQAEDPQNERYKKALAAFKQ